MRNQRKTRLRWLTQDSKRGGLKYSEPRAADFGEAEYYTDRNTANHRSRHRQKDLHGCADALASALPHIKSALPHIKVTGNPRAGAQLHTLRPPCPSIEASRESARNAVTWLCDPVAHFCGTAAGGRSSRAFALGQLDNFDVQNRVTAHRGRISGRWDETTQNIASRSPALRWATGFAYVSKAASSRPT
jgi:hypothetical protein